MQFYRTMLTSKLIVQQFLFPRVSDLNSVEPTKDFPPAIAEGKSFIQLFPPVKGSCFPPTGVKTRKLGFDSDCRGFFGCSNFLGICSKTSRNRSCLQRKLLLRGLAGMLAHQLSQFCEHGLHHQRLHHIEQQRKSYTHPQMCRTNIL